MSYEHTNPLEAFRDEIASWRDAELSGEKKSGHLIKIPDFDVNDLTEEDMDIWNKIEDGTITKEEADAYREKINKILRTGDLPRSRHEFAAFAANLITAVVGRREMRLWQEEEARKKEQK